MLKYILSLLLIASSIYAQRPGTFTPRTPGPVVITTPGGGGTSVILTNGIDGNTARGIAQTNIAGEIPAMLASGTNGIAVTNAFKVRVSSRGIINGLATIKNDGANFGPDTPGTTTHGIQEAINAFPKGINYGPEIVAKTIEFTGGYFYYTNKLIITNQFTTAPALIGAGILDTTLIYAGSESGINCIEFRGGTNRSGTIDGSSILNLPVHAGISKMTITALEQRTNVLVFITNSSYVDIREVNFTSWQLRTNQASGSGVSVYPLQVATAPGLVGLVIDAPAYDHNTTIKDIFFAGLATGVRLHSDHIYSENIKFSNIATWAGSATNKTLWPSNSIYSIGADIIESGGYDSVWNYCHFYTGNASIMGVNLDHSPKFNNCHFEGGVDVLSDNAYCASLDNPVSVGQTMDAFSAFVLKSPTGLSNASVNWSTNYYLKTAIAHPSANVSGHWPYSGSFVDFYVNRANTNVFSVYAGLGVFADGFISLINKFAINPDGSASFQDGRTTLYADGQIDIGAAHFGASGQFTNPVIAGIFYGSAGGITNYSRPFAALYAQARYDHDDDANQKISTNYVSSQVSGSVFGASIARGTITNLLAGNVTVSFCGNFVPVGATPASIFIYTNEVQTLIGIRPVGLEGVNLPISFSGSLQLPAGTRISMGVDDTDTAWESRVLTVSQ